MEKRCSKCKAVKDSLEFCQNKRREDGLHYYCKSCVKIMAKKQRLKVKKEFNGLYAIWASLKARCLNPKNERYHRYGGRGIIVCEEWRHSFLVFYAWAKDKHKEGLTIDRRDNEGNYCPENCRFVTYKENSRNGSTTKLNIAVVKRIKVLLRGMKLSQRKIGKIFGISNQTINGINTGKNWADVI